LCRRSRWRLVQTRFYTGVPDRADNEFWHRFWEGKLRAIGRQGVLKGVKQILVVDEDHRALEVGLDRAQGEARCEE
jgi:hypothetical protein